MKKKAVLAGIVVMAALLTPGCTPGGEKKAQTVYIKFPTATSSGTVYAIGAALANLWNEHIPNLQVSAEASNGGVQNLGLMAAGDAHVSVAVTSIITEQKQGINSFEGRGYDGVRILSALYSNYNQVVASGSSGINTLGDIRGKRFAPGAPGSTPEVETKVHFEMAGFKYPDDISAQFVGFTEAVDLIRNRQMDGAWIQAGLPTSAVSEICSTAGGKLISLDEDLISKLSAKYPWYNRAIIPAGMYEGQTQDVVTTSITITLIVDEGVSDDVVYEMAKVMWENIDILKRTHSALKDATIEDAVQNLADLPIHDGAQRYYKEKGVL
ncbi:MAG: TAXI family TRAP transporter solute-binding subunit [Spirochaetaceae bacterium]|jgi:TRAP transporter TAXI family solute receptor|nr:TAXI family TRAP transporter solute-binding subunit [Spirochaetaceae bacterium]